MKCLLTRNEVNVVRERILTGHLQYKDVKEGDSERGAGVRFKTGEVLRGEFYLWAMKPTKQGKNRKF